VPALWPRPTFMVSRLEGKLGPGTTEQLLATESGIGVPQGNVLIGIAPIPNRRCGCTGIRGVTMVISIKKENDPFHDSPDLNSILLRKTDPRSIEATWHGIGYFLGHFTPAECANYLANAGYASA
jgi:hypothetical protein